MLVLLRARLGRTPTKTPQPQRATFKGHVKVRGLFGLLARLPHIVKARPQLYP